jgi:NAD(P)-dependent dehydrogenase (short-subunit alcohol dehydrogenase family)
MVTWAGVRTEAAFQSLRKMNVQGLNPVMLDVTDPESVTAAVRAVKKKSGMLNALINNAGIAIGGPVEAVPLAEWRRQFDVNFFGLLSLTQACLPSLRESKGRIVNMSSISGVLASPYLAPYSSSKFAVEALSDSLRREVRAHGVHVCVVEPGAIDTPIWRKSIAHALGLSKSFSPDIAETYGDSLERFQKNIEKAELAAAPVSEVIKAVVHALTASPPRARYPVGKGIGLATAAVRMVPSKWMDFLLSGRI